MEANETCKVNKAKFLIFMHHEYGARECVSSKMTISDV